MSKYLKKFIFLIHPGNHTHAKVSREHYYKHSIIKRIKTTAKML